MSVERRPGLHDHAIDRDVFELGVGGERAEDVERPRPGERERRCARPGTAVLELEAIEPRAGGREALTGGPPEEAHSQIIAATAGRCAASWARRTGIEHPG